VSVGGGDFVYRLPFTVYRLPFTVCRLPFTVYRLPFTGLSCVVCRLQQLYPLGVRLVRLLAFLLVTIGVVLSGVSLAQTSGDDPIVVIEVGDPMDQRSIDYVAGAITTERAHAYILKIDSPGVSSGDLTSLFQAMAEASAPVIAWVGPSPAVAFTS